jgi:hypothetical protein
MLFLGYKISEIRLSYFRSYCKALQITDVIKSLKWSIFLVIMGSFRGKKE